MQLPTTLLRPDLFKVLSYLLWVLMRTPPIDALQTPTLDTPGHIEIIPFHLPNVTAPPTAEPLDAMVKPFSGSIGDQPVGLCSSPSPSRPLALDYCQHWFGLDLKKVGSCSSLISCGPGHHLDNHTCIKNIKEPSDLSVCSNHEYYISSRPVQVSPFVPTFLDPDLCLPFSIKDSPLCHGTKSVRRHISLIGFNKAEFLVSLPHSFIFTPDYSSIFNYKCDDCSNTGNCGQCDGDDVFRNNIGTHSKTAFCFCRVLKNPKLGSLKLVLDDATISIDYKISSVEWVLDTKDHNRAVSADSCSGCKATCQGPSLVLTDFPDSSSEVKVCAYSLCMSVAYSSTISLPLLYVLFPNNLRVTVFDGSLVMYKAEVYCGRQQTCDLIDCHFCWKKILNPRCYDVVDGFTIGMASILMLAILTIALKALTVVWFIATSCKLMIRVLWSFCKTILKVSLRLCGVSLNVSKRAYKKIEFYGDSNLTKVGTETTPSTSLPASPRPTLRMGEWKLLSSSKTGKSNTSSQARPSLMLSPRSQTLLVLTVLLVPLLNTTQACTTVTNLNFTSSECRPLGGKIECETSQVFDLTVGTTGSDACLLVSSQGGPMGSVHASITAVKTRCSEEFLYWTYDSSPLSQMNCHCWGELHCKEDTCTEDRLNSSIASAEGLILNQGPGLLACSKVKSEWLGKCVLPLDGCCFYSITFPPSRPSKIYRVTRCPSYFWEVGVTIKSYLSKVPEVHESPVTVGIERQMGPVKVLVTHISSPPAPISNSCFLYNPRTNETYYAECNKPTEQVLGRVGEIQCRTEKEAEVGSSDCSWNRRMISIQTDFTQIKPDIKYLSLETALAGQKLPLITPTINFKKDKYGFYMTRSLSETFNIRLRLPKLSTLLYSELGTCVMRFLKLSGCSDCLQGASLSFHAVCGSYPSLGTINCPSIRSQIPFVVNHGGNMSVKVMISQSALREDCDYTVGKSKGVIKIHGFLLVVPKISRAVLSGVNITSYDSNSGFWVNMGDNLSLFWCSIMDFFKVAIPWFLSVTILLFILLISYKLAKLLCFKGKTVIRLEKVSVN